MENKEWLQLATRKENGSHRELRKVHGNFAADGYRMHVVEGKPCKCKNEQTHRTTEQKIIPMGEKSRFVFAINRQFLLDALAGIETKVVVFFGDEKSPVIIQGLGDEGCDESRTALIMPVAGVDQETANFPIVYVDVKTAGGTPTK
jgi:hypothetical protein